MSKHIFSKIKNLNHLIHLLSRPEGNRSQITYYERRSGGSFELYSVHNDFFGGVIKNVERGHLWFTTESQVEIPLEKDQYTLEKVNSLSYLAVLLEKAKNDPKVIIVLYGLTEKGDFYIVDPGGLKLDQVQVMIDNQKLYFCLIP